MDSVLMGVNTNVVLVKMYHPTVDHNLQGDPAYITGCSTNIAGEFSMVSINIKMSNHFNITDRKDDLIESQCAEQPLPQDLWTDIPWAVAETVTVACFT